MIEVQKVSLFYENKQALKEIDFTLKPGTIVGLIGPNGAGKTSLLRVMMGIITEFVGEVFIEGHSVKKDRQWIKQHCSYAPEDTQLFPYLSGREFLQLIATLKQHNTSELQELIELLQMQDFIDHLIVDYSHGMRQKMLLSVALLGSPRYLFIDEALNGLDVTALFNLKHRLEELKKKGSIILLSSHVIPLITGWADEVLILHQSELINRLDIACIQQLENEQNQPFEQIFFRMISDR